MLWLLLLLKPAAVLNVTTAVPTYTDTPASTGSSSPTLIASGPETNGQGMAVRSIRLDLEILRLDESSLHFLEGKRISQGKTYTNKIENGEDS